MFPLETIGGKVYPYTYPYAYAEVSQNTLVIESDSYEDSPCKITIFGPCRNSVWKHYVDNELLEMGWYEGSIMADHIKKSITIKQVSADVNKLVLYDTADYATDGAWLPLIVSDGLPAYIKAKEPKKA